MGDRALRLLVALLAALAGLQGLVGGVLVLVATQRWGLHPSAYGAFLAAGAVGNVPGALLANRIVTRIGNVPALIGCALLSGLGYLVMAFAHGWVVGGAAFAFVGFAIAAGSVIANSLRQRLTPAELMGRVGSAWRGIVWGAFPIGSLIGGALASFGGLQLPVLIAGVAQCAVAVGLAAPLTRSARRGGTVAHPGRRRRRPRRATRHDLGSRGRDHSGRRWKAMRRGRARTGGFTAVRGSGSTRAARRRRGGGSGTRGCSSARTDRASR